jgi:integrase
MEDELISKNPAASLGKTKVLPTVVRSDTDPFTKDELVQIMNTANLQMYLVYNLLYRAGLRQGELVALRWGDVDLANRVITVKQTVSRGKLVLPKNGKPRKVDISVDLRAALGFARATDDNYVLPGPGGGMLDVRTLQRWHTAIMEGAGVRYRSLHNFRHTFAVHLLQAGAQMAYIQQMLGHSSIKVTIDVYGRFAPGSVRDVDLLDDAGVDDLLS